MSESLFYPRYVERRLEEALEDSPVVLIHGPRQCGKTTLAQFAYAPNYLKWGDDYLKWGDDRFTWGASWKHRDYTYISFDDAVTRDGARADPMGLLPTFPSASSWMRYNVFRSCSKLSRWKWTADWCPAVSYSPVPPMCCSSQLCPSPWRYACKSFGYIRWHSRNWLLDQHLPIHIQELDS